MSVVRLVEERDGAWARIVLDRPPGNLLSLEMVRGLAAALQTAGATGRQWVTLEGSGTQFSYGAMLQEHVPGVMEHVLPETHALLRQLLSHRHATAALVEGRCLGGGFELALACDVVIATDDAVLGLPEIDVGSFPPGAAALLPLRVGASRATEAILSGTSRPATAWRETGVVSVVCPRGGLLQAAGEWFDKHLAGRSAAAISTAAQAARLTLRTAAEPALAAAERLYLEGVLPTHDASEGVRAFIEKRPPKWKHC